MDQRICGTGDVWNRGREYAVTFTDRDGVIIGQRGIRQNDAVPLDEIKKVTTQPIKYVIYSHSHYDHIAGGKPFKDLGAKFIAHRNAKAQLQRFPNADVVMPDELVGNSRTIRLGGTTLELSYVGRNHSDNSLVMRLPKEKIIFAVDFVPVQSLPFRNMPDTTNPLEWQASLKRVAALDWDRMIPGHPYPIGRLGTKQDVADLIGYFDDLGSAVKTAAAEGKCTDTAMKDVKLPKYEKWANYAAFLPMNVERMCYLANGN